MNPRLEREVREALNAASENDPRPTLMTPALWDMLLSYENGELDMAGTLDMYRLLIQSGLAWTLQGSYGRDAERLLMAGIITCQRVNDGPLVCRVVQI